MSHESPGETASPHTDLLQWKEGREEGGMLEDVLPCKAMPPGVHGKHGACPY